MGADEAQSGDVAMAMSNRTKIGIVLAVGVLAGLTSALLSLLLLAVAGFLIAWGQNPKDVEAFFENLPLSDYSSKAFSRLNSILS
jgi:hypothetical protein